MPSKRTPSEKKRAPLSQRKLANVVFVRAELQDIRLASCKATHNFKAGATPPFQVEMSVGGHAHVHKTERKLAVTAKVDVSGSPVNASEQKLEIGCVFLLLYNLSSIEGLEEQNYTAFTKFIAMNNAWPYAREFIHQMTSRLGLPPFRLPLYKPESEGFVTEGNDDS